MQFVNYQFQKTRQLLKRHSNQIINIFNKQFQAILLLQSKRQSNKIIAHFNNMKKTQYTKIQQIKSSIKTKINLKFTTLKIHTTQYLQKNQKKYLLNCSITDGSAIMIALFDLSKKDVISLNCTYQAIGAIVQDKNDKLVLMFPKDASLKKIQTQEFQKQKIQLLSNISIDYMDKTQEEAQRRRFMTKPKRQENSIDQAQKQFLQYASSRSKSHSQNESLQKNSFHYNFQSRNFKKSPKKEQVTNSAKDRFKRQGLSALNHFINNVYQKMEYQKFHFVRTKKQYQICDEFCNQPLNLTSTEIDQIIKHETQWGVIQNCPQDEIDYVIRMRIFEKNFAKYKSNLEQILMQQRKTAQRANLLYDKTGHFSSQIDRNRKNKNRRQKNISYYQNSNFQSNRSHKNRFYPLQKKNQQENRNYRNDKRGRQTRFQNSGQYR